MSQNVVSITDTIYSSIEDVEKLTCTGKDWESQVHLKSQYVLSSVYGIGPKHCSQQQTAETSYIDFFQSIIDGFKALLFLNKW